MKRMRDQFSDKIVNKTPEIVKRDPYLKDFENAISKRIKTLKDLESELIGEHKCLIDFANGHKFFGLQDVGSNWVIREWAPNATEVYLIGDFSNWSESDEYSFIKVGDGIWELHISKKELKHLDFYKLKIFWKGGSAERIPSYANYVVQDDNNKSFCSRVWSPEAPYKFKNRLKSDSYVDPIIYEAHIGMSQEFGEVGTYRDFTSNVLPRILDQGYNTIQLMAIQEHPYYGSFGYQVSNFFAPTSRCGTPEELKELIDVAHGYGLRVIMDIVHSHAVKNEGEGLSNFDGTNFQYFHKGARGHHEAWDTMCFNYGRPEVLHFLLSNCKYWLEEFNFDGFRFDGVTSMLYLNHGLGMAFSSYDDYFNSNVDEDAVLYFALANKLIKDVDRNSISIAEDMSGMPGLGVKLEDGGFGFDYRLAMGVPDFWIKILKEKLDEEWNLDEIWFELNNMRFDEKSISYVESHDQALVGDKTVIFRLIDKDMYDHMSISSKNHIVDRGISLHKLIRMITISTAAGGYLNFMGNEFGHPEWIDFPREGNEWSYHYARRQWSLRDNKNLCYKFLADFDRDMLKIVKNYNVVNSDRPKCIWIHNDDKVIAYERSGLVFIFNFHGDKTYKDYAIPVKLGDYKEILNSDSKLYGGTGRLPSGRVYKGLGVVGDSFVNMYLPERSVSILERV